MIQDILAICGMLSCGVIGFIGGYVFRYWREEVRRNEADN